MFFHSLNRSAVSRLASTTTYLLFYNIWFDQIDTHFDKLAADRPQQQNEMTYDSLYI